MGNREVYEGLVVCSDTLGLLLQYLLLQGSDDGRACALVQLVAWRLAAMAEGLEGV